MSAATITSKGQVTIPADIRKALGLEPGTKVVFTPSATGTVIMRAKTRSIMDVKGSLKPPPKGRKVKIEDMSFGTA